MIDIDTIESYYFNTGTEWEVAEVDDEEVNEEDLESIDTDCSFYSTEWGYDDTKEELASAFGYDKEDVIMLEFDGWKKTAHYKRV